MTVYMNSFRLVFLGFLLLPLSLKAGAVSGSQLADQWRAEHRIIDLHQHLDCTTQRLARAVRIMDAVGIGIAVNLSGGTVTKGQGGGISEFEQNKTTADALYPARFL